MIHERRTTKPRWYRSLYWRIALGLIAFLAIMLAAEGGIVLWMTDRIAGSMPARSPRRLAALVASDLGTALTANNSLDIEDYIREQFGQTLQTFVVIMRDGQILANHLEAVEHRHYEWVDTRDRAAHPRLDIRFHVRVYLGFALSHTVRVTPLG